MPQILELSENCGILPVSYAEYYYENYLQEQCDLIGVIILEKKRYLQLVKTSKYESDPFFVALKAAEDESDIKSRLMDL